MMTQKFDSGKDRVGRSAVSEDSFPEVWVPSLEADFSLGVFYDDDGPKDERALLPHRAQEERPH